jgi:hypothetical protein
VRCRERKKGAKGRESEMERGLDWSWTNIVVLLSTGLKKFIELVTMPCDKSVLNDTPRFRLLAED